MFVLPVIGLVLGTSFVPQRHALRLLLHGLPARRIAVFASMALATMIAWSLVAALAIGGYVLAASFRQNAGAWAVLVSGYGLVVFLHGGLFASLGLALAAFCRRRATALVVGLSLLILLGAVLPSLRSSWVDHYQLTHDNAYIMEMLRGDRSPDATYRALGLLSRIPTNALLHASSQAFGAADAIAFNRAPCPTCGPTGESDRLLVVVGTSVFLLLGGALAYAHREET